MEPSKTSRTPPFRVAVVGGGISGLAAACHLRATHPNTEVKLLEADAQLGGLIQTVENEGYLLEHGADNFITQPPWAANLCEQIGFGDELIPTSDGAAGAMVVCRGRLEKIPEGFVVMSPRRLFPIMKSRILNTWGKLRLACEPLIPARLDESDESLASFARRRLGRQAYRRLVQPLVGGIYTGDPERLSLRATLPRFAQWEQAHGSLLRAAWKTKRASTEQSSGQGARYRLFTAPRRGMNSLVNQLGSLLPRDAISLNSRVEQLQLQSDQSWQLQLGANQDKRLTVDGVILATPASATARLLEELAPPVSHTLHGIDHAPCALVWLGYDRQQIGVPLDAYGMVVPHCEDRKILSATFSSIKYEGRAPTGHLLVRVFLGGALQPELVDLPEHRIEQIAVDEIRSLLQVSGPPQMVGCHRLPRAMPQYYLGHQHRVQEIEQQIRHLPAFALAGNAYHGVGVPQCIQSGQAAADSIMEQWHASGLTHSPTPTDSLSGEISR